MTALFRCPLGLAPLPQGRMGRLGQATVRRTRGRSGLRGALHPSRRHRQLPADRTPRRRRDVQMEGLPDQRSRSPKDDDASGRRVHSPLPHSRAAERLPPHSPLQPVGQRGARARNIARVRQLLTAAEQSNPNDAAHDPGEPDPPNPYPCPCCGGGTIVAETFVALPISFRHGTESGPPWPFLRRDPFRGGLSHAPQRHGGQSCRQKRSDSSEEALAGA